MKRMMVVMVLVLMLTGLGCARFLGVDSKTEFGKSSQAYNPEQVKAYNRWMAIDPDKLSAEQEAALKNAKSPRTATEKVQAEQFIAHYPWINSRQLSTRDKIFLAEEGHGFVETLLR